MSVRPTAVVEVAEQLAVLEGLEQRPGDGEADDDAHQARRLEHAGGDAGLLVGHRLHARSVRQVVGEALAESRDHEPDDHELDAGARVDEREARDAEADEHHAERHQLLRAEAGDHPAADRRHRDERDAEHEEHEAGLERVEVEDVLEVQREEEQDGAEHPVADERDDVRACEPHVAEQRELDQRRPARSRVPRDPTFRDRERGEQHDPDDDRPEHDRRAPPRLRALLEPEDQGHEPGGQQHEAGPVDAAREGLVA